MKFWVKIVVAFSIVVVACVGVWAFFFKETDEAIVYNRMCELVDYKQSLGLNERATDLQDSNYYGGNKENTFATDTDDAKKVENYRKIILNKDRIAVEDNGGGVLAYYGSYLMYDNQVDETLEYILPYLNGTKVNAKSRRTTTKAISEYVDSLEAVSIALDDVINFQNSMKGEAKEYSLLVNHYNELRIRYRTSLKCAGEVITCAIEYLDTSIYSGEIKFDTTLAFGDAFGITLKTAMSTELITEVNYSCDAYKVFNTLSAYRWGRGEEESEKFDLFDPYDTEHYIGYGEYEFLTSYNSLFGSHRDTLKSILSKPNAVKKEMAGGSGLSGIVEKAQDDVVTVLNVLGFGK